MIGLLTAQRQRRRRITPNTNTSTTTMISTHNHVDMAASLVGAGAVRTDATAAHPSKQLGHGHPGHARPRLPEWPPLPNAPVTQHRPGLISLTCNEVQHLFVALLARPAGDLRPSAALVALATPTSGPRSHLPLPTTGQRTMKFMIYGWVIRWVGC